MGKIFHSTGHRSFNSKYERTCDFCLKNFFCGEIISHLLHCEMPKNELTNEQAKTCLILFMLELKQDLPYNFIFNRELNNFAMHIYAFVYFQKFLKFIRISENMYDRNCNLREIDLEILSHNKVKEINIHVFDHLTQRIKNTFQRHRYFFKTKSLKQLNQNYKIISSNYIRSNLHRNTKCWFDGLYRNKM